MPTTTLKKCTECALPAEFGRYCEVCGGDLDEGVQATDHTWKSSAATETNADHPGGSGDHVELDLSVIAAATDVGKRHHYNQDAVAIGAVGGRRIAVICDGVSNATDSERAALAGAEAAVTEIEQALKDGENMEKASRRGVNAAHTAVATVGAQYPQSPPSSTYVSAIVDDTEVVICWVGDSRAYWVGDDDSMCLTVDDTIAARLEYHGVDESDERYRSPYAKALLAWLGSDAPSLQPNLARYIPDSGHIVVCSDGLSRYMDSPDDLRPLPDGTVGQMAVALTQQACDYGGADNISVAITRFNPPVVGGATSAPAKSEADEEEYDFTAKLGMGRKKDFTELLGGGTT
ncbi:PP2C family protein-serine/threonine phosphatase [Natronoglycomyces albus]|uniref:Protein phosphatase 2C domain-containing protein n=1 Tax=Natronoglycomyces albus TaxID=2811108 RepID=A0A895XS87_9ACTN|nr:protein phosphatase 2C domain-containing protein [Natronoglycomyces albus]QSB06373.1 protein phosphatase 2C domain-containing protein [Natronoglycomyces albus]